MNANIIAYTDGSFRKELNIGGWSAVLIKDNEISEFSQGGFATDVSTMELKAIILALENTPLNSNVTIYSDAKSHVDVIQSILSKNIKLPSKNRDTWQYLTEIMNQRNVSCAWIKGHSGIEGNVRANELAYQALLEFKKYPHNKEVEQLLAVEIPTKYKEKKSLLIRFDDIMAIKSDSNTIAKLQEKKKGLEKAIIKQEYLIRKCNPEFKQKGQLPKNKKVKCLYCHKLFKKESHRDQHIRDKHGYPDYLICCYCGIKLVIE